METRRIKMETTDVWNTFTVNGNTYDPNKWIIDRGNGCVGILAEDGKLIDEPPDDQIKSDAAAIRWGIIWLMMRRTDDGMTSDGRHIFDTCLAD
jgi:hypothetical protein